MNTSADKTLSVLIKEKAYNLGFDLCGITSSKILKEHEPILRNWCSAGMNGQMNYLCESVEKRINPGLLIRGSKSVIVTGLNYFTGKKQGGGGIPIISRYAYGVNYHDVIKGKQSQILDYINNIIPEAKGKAFVDSAPILEKAWAREAGLGWFGRHSILINNKIGSFFFLGVIILDIALDYDEPLREDHCGTCRLCIDSCPTGAINENRTINVRKCIAYLTIEDKCPIPQDLIRKMEGRVFGCDKCQDICPWNKNARPHQNPEFELSAELELMTEEGWLNLSREQFIRLFKSSVIRRRKYARFKRNIESVTKKGS